MSPAGSKEWSGRLDAYRTRCLDADEGWNAMIRAFLAT